MAKAIMIQGTMSSAGKSYIVTGLCRYYARLGFSVAPFKSQNMALNSFITRDGFEMGRAQVVQAEAAGKEPSVLMNPILLKPTTDVGSQVIVEGKSIGNMRAREYFKYKPNLIPNILNAYETLAKDNDIIIIEGAGSPAEINLRENDIVNMGLANLLDVPVLLAGDIDPGGVFAQLHGTIDLLTNEERDRIKGLIINKFRGDVELLRPGIKMLEDKCNKPVIGVLPMSNAKIDEEDSITSAFKNKQQTKAILDIAIIKLPRISNFTDASALSIIDEVSVRYVDKPSELMNPDLIIIPGTKSTISDLRWLKESGLFDMIKGISKERPVFGICGGYQMMGEFIEDPFNIEGGGKEFGLGLLPIKTVLGKEKITKQVEGTFENVSGVFSFLNNKKYKGYEIHNGESTMTNSKACPMAFGTYIHGIFDSREITEEIVNFLLKEKGLSEKNIDVLDISEYKKRQYDIIADTIEANMDIKMLNEIIGI